VCADGNTVLGASSCEQHPVAVYLLSERDGIFFYLQWHALSPHHPSHREWCPACTQHFEQYRNVFYSAATITLISQH